MSAIDRPGGRDRDRDGDRDRGDDGRARNARPRDGLGRPLPYGAPGVARQPEGVARSAEQTLVEAQRLLDQGRPFHAHEVFEDAWKAASRHAAELAATAPSEGGPSEGGPSEAGLWKALAQLAVGVTHDLRGNAAGAARLLDRAAAGLEPYAADPPYGLDLAALRAWAQNSAVGAMPVLRRAGG